MTLSLFPLHFTSNTINWLCINKVTWHIISASGLGGKPLLLDQLGIVHDELMILEGLPLKAIIRLNVVTRKHMHIYELLLIVEVDVLGILVVSLIIICYCGV